MHVLIEVSRILEETIAHHVAWLLKFGLSRWDLPTEEKKKQTKKNPNENQANLKVIIPVPQILALSGTNKEYTILGAVQHNFKQQFSYQY